VRIAERCSRSLLVVEVVLVELMDSACHNHLRCVVLSCIPEIVVRRYVLRRNHFLEHRSQDLVYRFDLSHKVVLRLEVVEKLLLLVLVAVHRLVFSLLVLKVSHPGILVAVLEEVCCIGSSLHPVAKHLFEVRNHIFDIQHQNIIANEEVVSYHIHSADRNYHFLLLVSLRIYFHRRMDLNLAVCRDCDRHSLQCRRRDCYRTPYRQQLQQLKVEEVLQGVAGWRGRMVSTYHAETRDAAFAFGGQVLRLYANRDILRWS